MSQIWKYKAGKVNPPNTDLNRKSILDFDVSTVETSDPETKDEQFRKSTLSGPLRNCPSEVSSKSRQDALSLDVTLASAGMAITMRSKEDSDTEAQSRTEKSELNGQFCNLPVEILQKSRPRSSNMRMEAGKLKPLYMAEKRKSREVSPTDSDADEQQLKKLRGSFQYPIDLLITRNDSTSTVPSEKVDNDYPLSVTQSTVSWTQIPAHHQSEMVGEPQTTYVFHKVADRGLNYTVLSCKSLSNGGLSSQQTQPPERTSLMPGTKLGISPLSMKFSGNNHSYICNSSPGGNEYFQEEKNDNFFGLANGCNDHPKHLDNGIQVTHEQQIGARKSAVLHRKGPHVRFIKSDEEMKSVGENSVDELQSKHSEVDEKEPELRTKVTFSHIIDKKLLSSQAGELTLVDKRLGNIDSPEPVGVKEGGTDQTVQQTKSIKGSLDGVQGQKGSGEKVGVDLDRGQKDKPVTRNASIELVGVGSPQLYSENNCNPDMETGVQTKHATESEYERQSEAVCHQKTSDVKVDVHIDVRSQKPDFVAVNVDETQGPVGSPKNRSEKKLDAGANITAQKMSVTENEDNKQRESGSPLKTIVRKLGTCLDTRGQEKSIAGRLDERHEKVESLQKASEKKLGADLDIEHEKKKYVKDCVDKYGSRIKLGSNLNVTTEKKMIAENIVDRQCGVGSNQNPKKEKGTQVVNIRGQENKAVRVHKTIVGSPRKDFEMNMTVNLGGGARTMKFTTKHVLEREGSIGSHKKASEEVLVTDLDCRAQKPSTVNIHKTHADLASPQKAREKNPGGAQSIVIQKSELVRVTMDRKHSEADSHQKSREKEVTVGLDIRAKLPQSRVVSGPQPGGIKPKPAQTALRLKEHLNKSKPTMTSQVKLKGPVSDIVSPGCFQGETSGSMPRELVDDVQKRALTEQTLDYVKHEPAPENTASSSQRVEKRIFNTTWSSRLEVALRLGRALLLQNLDPWFSSFEIGEMLQELLQVGCDVRMLPPKNFACYTSGKALVIFKSQEDVNKALRTFAENLLILSKDERPVIASVAEVQEEVDSCLGFFRTNKYKSVISHEGTATAVSTSHCSQPNTLEFELGLEWRQLQDQETYAWTFAAQEHKLAIDLIHESKHRKLI